MTALPPTPELNRMSAAITEHKTQKVGEFIAWLDQEGYVICRYDRDCEAGGHVVYETLYWSPQEWLADMHGIDLRKVDEERQRLLEFTRLTALADKLSKPVT